MYIQTIVQKSNDLSDIECVVCACMWWWSFEKNHAVDVLNQLIFVKKTVKKKSCFHICFCFSESMQTNGSQKDLMETNQRQWKLKKVNESQQESTKINIKSKPTEVNGNQWKPTWVNKEPTSIVINDQCEPMTEIETEYMNQRYDKQYENQ